MPNLLNVDHALISGFVEEFAGKFDAKGETAFTCIYRSAGFPDERQVFLVRIGDRAYSLKIDLMEGQTDRLRNEFAVLQDLHDHFREFDNTRIVRPEYLSPSGRFFVTEYIDRPTATEVIRKTPDSLQAAQVYRRAGEWLHDFKDQTRAEFTPQWMFDTIATLVHGTPKAAATSYSPMINMLRQQGESLTRRNDTCGFAHGDFHGENLLIGKGATYGIDFTEATEKHLVYDIVDFLKMDVFRPANPDELDRSGILRVNKEMFLRQYRHALDIDILDFCIRMRLLIDWLSITEAKHASSSFQRRKFDLIHDRLQQALRIW
ncbi:phosphotransferase [Ruegeria sp. 2012CJ41-6]|uniref:Phosphotransferase n=1 Tax=Ruegeria spongiae TaxID=2942209 RepID=A0ABT0Q9N7_9RHOB|nr:phosphotransferase [Ruegeria spongiae]MCL6285883.1 phosphotransferase [Ruegeria spongiae]